MEIIQAWTLIPFAIMLIMIAVAPLAAEKFWESNRNKLICTMVITIPTATYLIAAGLGHELMHQMFNDYFPFITLLVTLFVVTGGIFIKGDVSATPLVNSSILVIGYILASLMGTTGAAMLMIRPLLEINKQRTKKTHTVLFFIAMVANAGGVLTPLGDPPLFLLYLRGAPFTWFSSLFPAWLFVGAMLLTIYLITDNIYYKKEPISALRDDLSHIVPIRVKGRMNFIWLGATIAAVVLVNEHYIPAMGKEDCFFLIKYLREIILIGITLLSLKTTNRRIRKRNGFSWAPILEVAILFVGIFTTMTPALMFLNQNASMLGITSASQFYYFTGALSAFLDNSPTAVAFHTVATGLDMDTAGAVIVAGVPEAILRAISLGAVMFGSMTYIGNGPNFMVKAIAEEKGVHMPSFFSYMLKFSLTTLLPIYILAQLIFL